ncbi:muconolactone delta-isomerase [Rhodococcus sp. ABRD24]|uniref:muconolactone Delta-isomerase n=1 Tax=Rhodococcus sp. ABRD24 TaxID=2507582 RepID=UPI00103E5F85|nr:muconolactone Delta-isomerase family protein [Rhodococcus sp. ABRD24]QBJ98690.1 muconolactone delta-isomerase [Rhodococcus sp. ABRD24]
MEFLVNIRINIPADMPEEQYNKLVVDERELAALLAEKGTLKRMWRVPGRRENWGLWSAIDATELHETLSSLPVWPWMDLDVHPLAQHPVDPASR